MKGTFTQSFFFTLFRAGLVLLSGLLLWAASDAATVLPHPLVPLVAQLVVSGMLLSFLFCSTLRRLLRPLQVVYSDEAVSSSNLNFFKRSAPLQSNRVRSITGLIIVAFFLATSVISAQSLLIDVTTSNTTPTANDVVTYKVRYRCASITNHCFNSHITFTLPDAFEIVSTPGTGGNVASSTMVGNAVDVYLVSPPSAGAPAGALAAGASGILETKVKFKCGTNGVAPMPAAGTTVNFTVLPTFTVTGGSQVAVAPPAVTVPTVSACPVPDPNPPATNISKNREAGFNGLLQQGGSSYYAIGIPAMAIGEMWVLEDDVPPGVLITNINSGGNPTPTIDVYVAGVWYSTGLIWQSWITNNNTNSEGAQLFATRISDGMFVPVPGCFRVGLTTLGVDRVRMNVVGPRTAATTFIDFILAQDAPPGTYINCVSSNNPAWTTVCAQPIYITEKPVINNLLFTENYFRLGTTDLSLINVENWYTVSGNPNLPKDPLDAVATMDLRSFNLQGGGLVYEQLLPVGFEYSTDPTRPNFWFQSIRNVNSCSSTPTFTVIPNYSGTQTLLRWEYPSCSGYIDVRIYFSFRYTATAALPSSLCMSPVISLFNGGQLAQGTPPVCVTSFTGGTLCRDKPIDGGDVNSIKLVKGALDASFSRYPLTGNTNLAGDGVYEIFISSADWQNVKQIDIADILPYVGDQAMLTASARGSAWSEELAAAITVERFKIGTGLVNASANLPLGVMYTTAANPCYLTAAQPTGQVKADVALANFGMAAGCTDFSGATPAAGAKGFLFRWANTADPLVFGEYLKLTIPVRQLTGEADNLTGGVAWNSVAYTATEADDDELLSSEPIKVGLKMIDPNTTAAIGDYVWLDGNANGRQDAGETPVSGVVVSLYDAAGQPVTQTVTSGGGTIQVPVTTITDGNGYYCFPGLTPNTNYAVRLESVTNFGSGGNLSTYSLTLPDEVADDVDSDATLGTLAGSPVTPRPQISSPTLGAGTQTKTYDFGFVCLGSISGYAWMDTDKEGDQDNSEMGLSGITVTLHNAVTDAAIGSSVMTNGSGNFTLSNIPAGSYYVEFTTFPGTKVPTSKDATGNDNNDSDVNTSGRTDVFTLGSCDFLKFDLGLKDIPLNPASICGTAWDDLNKDGTFDASEPGIANITVQLLNSSGFVINSTVTDAFGDYCFNNLDPNVGYQVAFVPPSITIMFSAAGPDQDVDLTTGITTLTYVPINDETINDVDAGFMGPLSIGNLVWKDINDDGLYDPAEPTFSGIPVNLIASDGTTILATTTTDVNGRYIFKNLMAGSYFVESGVPTGGFRSSNDIATSTTPNDIDSDDNGVGIASTGFVRSSLITLANDGGTPGDANWTEGDALQSINGMIDPAVNPKAYYTVDFGFVCAQPTVPVFTQMAATCNLLVPNNNGSITLTSVANGTHFGVSTLNAATYDGPSTIGTATAIALPQLIKGSIPNTGGTYIVRLFNNVGDCYVDVPVTVAAVGCVVPCALTAATKTLETCNSNGTTGTGADDYITFSLNPTGTGLGASYSVTANNGGTVTLAASGNAATGIAYGSATAFRLQNGSANGTSFTITVTDVSGAPCVVTTTVQQSACSSFSSSCKEFIYVNEVTLASGGRVHKFEVNGGTTAITEIMNGGGAWYPGAGSSVLPFPHGLGWDRNGYLYIGSTYFAPNQIRRLDCAGNITPTGTFSINNVDDLYNIDSYDGFIYSNGDLGRIYKWDPCTGAQIGYVQLGNGSTDWGFSIDDNGKFYVTNQSGKAWIFTPTAADFTAFTTFFEVIDLFGNPSQGGALSPPYSATGLNGITSDDAGNIYIVEGNRDAINTPSRLLKFSSTGAFLAAGPIDANGSDGAGWNQMTGIVYSSTANRLYTTSLNPSEDCVYRWNTDLTSAGAAIGPVPGIGQAKGIAILSECCPVTSTVNISSCDATLTSRVSLSDLLPTDGVVCDGQWALQPGSSNFTFNSCDVTATPTGFPACATLTLSNSGVTNAPCTPYTVTVNVSLLADITAQTIAGNQTVCSTDNPAAFTVTTAASVNPPGATITYQWQQSTTSCTDGFTDIPGAMSATYDPGPISQTTYFRVIARITGCAAGVCEDISNCVTLTLGGCPPACALNPADLTIPSLTFGSGFPPVSETVTINGGANLLPESNIGGFYGAATSEGALYSFCTEINQPLLPLQNPYTHIYNGAANGFTAAIALRIAQVVQAAGFNSTTGFGAGNNTTANFVALQLAVWNAIYDTDYSVSNGAGTFYSTTNANGALATANGWLTAAQAITAPTVVVHNLHNATGQDLLKVGNPPATITLAVTAPTCAGAGAPNNAGITISNFTNQRYRYSSGTAFNAGSAIPASITAIPVGGVIATTLPNTSLNYTVRIYDATDDNCYVDQVVTVTAVNCCALTAATKTFETCNSNGTIGDGTDDYITFSLNPTGTGLGASYSVTANNGGTVTLAAGGAATGIAYGSVTAFRLQNGSSNGTLYTITVTDVSGAPCVATTTVQQNTTCSAPPPCALTAITFANPSPCNNNGTNVSGVDDYFTADITVTFSNPPATGNLVLTGDVLVGGGASVVTVATAGAGPTYTFVGVRLRADGTASAVTATFSADNACTFSVTNGPNVPSCSSCVAPVLATNTGTVCTGNSISLTSLVTSNSPAGVLTFYTSQSDANAATNVLVNSTVAPVANTTYYVRSETALNCFSTASVSVTVANSLVPTVTNGSVCAGGSINLATLVTNSGGGTLSFYTTQADANAGTNALGSSTVSPTTATNYYVRSTAGGCYGVKEITVNIAPVACGSIIITGPN